MNEELKQLILVLLADKIKVTSWGITNINTSDSSLEFNVSGFLYQGKVKIDALLESYIICINGDTIKCQLEEVVSILDSKIEKSSNYIEDITEWIK